VINSAAKAHYMSSGKVSSYLIRGNSPQHFSKNHFIFELEWLYQPVYTKNCCCRISGQWKLYCQRFHYSSWLLCIHTSIRCHSFLWYSFSLSLKFVSSSYLSLGHKNVN